MSVATNIKTIRQMQGMSQQDLADIIGVTQSYISIYESGMRTPGNETLQKIAGGLGVSVELLKAETLKVTAKAIKAKKD